MKTISQILGLIAIITISSILVFATKNSNTSNNNYNSNTSETYKIKALKIPPNLEFSGERVPTEQEDVKERLDRELLVNTYWQSNGLLLIKRSHLYFPIIEPILKAYGVPDDFKYLAVIESGLQNVTSPTGAKGFWQLLEGTAEENGLEVNSNVDERYNLEKATEAACKYILEAKNKFGSWTLAAAAYNAGMNGIQDKIDTQKVTNYYDLLVGDETNRYVLRMVAVKEILTHPKRYGFIFDEDDLYKLAPTKQIQIDSTITNIAEFSLNLGINYKIMKLHNPWLRENTLNNKTGKIYQIKIPTDKK